MKFTKKWKNFWQLQKHTTGGFTLVELIVVIAILAILAGIGVPAYSGYVTKANQQADQTLMSEVAHALELGYYSGLDVESGYVTLSATGATASAEDVTAAMDDAFGDGWEDTLMLKSNWLSSFEGSSYDNNEDRIISAIDTLTDALSGTIADLVGDQFTAYMNGLGVDTTDKNAVADAAVFYIANQAADMTSSEKQAVYTAVQEMNQAQDAAEILGRLYAQGMAPVEAAAAMYALAEGLCTTLGDADVTATFNAEIEAIGNNTYADQDAAVAAVMTALGKAQQKAIEKGLSDKMGKYFTEGKATSDMNAYFDMMSAVAGADAQVKDSFGTDGCFANLSELVDIVAGGGVVIFLQEEDGELTVINTAKAE